MSGIFIDVHLRDNTTGEHTVYQDSYEYNGLPDEQDLSPEMQSTHFWLGGEGTGYFGKQERYHVEKIVERETGRMIYEATE